FDSRLRMRSGTLEGAARFEENLPKTTRLRFFRQTYTARYTFPLSHDDDLLVGLEYRPVKYPERTVEFEDEDGDEYEEVRKDRRWKPQVRWSRQWTGKLLTDLEYEYEMRLSNDPEKRYRGHVITFGTVVEW
ncbi:MAG TPA: hypothetical protein VM939_05300, partial [Gemmatimonadaceae bacterium]|nr:hypothetical protein [Gemmatimonadaceae bacterium]